MAVSTNLRSLSQSLTFLGPYGCSYPSGVLCMGVLVIRALLFGVYIDRLLTCWSGASYIMGSGLLKTPMFWRLILGNSHIPCIIHYRSYTIHFMYHMSIHIYVKRETPHCGRT